MKEDAAETGFQNGSGQIGGEKLCVPASVIPLGSETRRAPSEFSHLAPKPIRKEAGAVGIPSIVVKAANLLRIKSVNGVFALTFTSKLGATIVRSRSPLRCSAGLSSWMSADGRIRKSYF